MVERKRDCPYLVLPCWPEVASQEVLQDASALEKET